MIELKINIGRATSGGVFNGLFGNPVREETVSEQYREHIRRVLQEHPKERVWLRQAIGLGGVLFCPGCGVGSPTCHARILEEELKKFEA